MSLKLALHITYSHPFIHPALHLASFAIFAVLLTVLANSPTLRWVALFAAILFGSILELLEHLIYHQPLELSDIRLDGYGAAFGFLAYLWLVRRGRPAAVTAGSK
jgi:hypothetical protein